MRSGQPGAIVTIDIVEGPDSAEPVAIDFEQFIQLIGQSAPD